MEVNIIDYIMGFVMFLLGIIVNATRDSIKELKVQDAALADKVQKIELLVVGDYVKRDELKEYLDNIDEKLDKIFDRIDKKADKTNGTV